VVVVVGFGAAIVEVVVVDVVVVDVVVVVGAGIDTVTVAGEPTRVVVALPEVSVIEKVDALVRVTAVEDEAAIVVETAIAHFVVDCCVMEEIVPPTTVKS
jgi:hypothetical protein